LLSAGTVGELLAALLAMPMRSCISLLSQAVSSHHRGPGLTRSGHSSTGSYINLNVLREVNYVPDVVNTVLADFHDR
jgi:hypothetical protein